ncbi:MAG: leucine-rich repeat domain-containing protein [Oscillospiraceae bacterium]|nr:leucine-rich repeat domain-containing protein [Oscillospiraceae bacterium]
MRKIISVFMSLVFVMLTATVVTAADKVEAAWSIEGDYYYSVKNGEATIESYYGSGTGHIAVPQTLGGYPVTGLASTLFYYETGLTGVTLPDTIRSIGSYAFYGTRYYNDRANWTGELLYIDEYLVDSGTLLGNIRIKDGTRVIADSVLEGKDMKELYIPQSVENLGEGALIDCEKLQKITVHEDNPYFASDENGILYNKDKSELMAVPQKADIGEIVLPESVKSIAPYAFADTSLTQITLPDELEEIGEAAFRDTGINHIIIPKAIDRLEDYTFDGCKKMRYITFCGKVNYIGYYALGGCENLRFVFFEGYHYGEKIDIFNGNEAWDKASQRYGFDDGIAIDAPQIDTLVYGDKLVLDIIKARNFDESATLVWGKSEEVELEISEDGTHCVATPSIKGNRKRYVSIECVAQKEDSVIHGDDISLTVDCRWYQKIFAFFRMIFGLIIVYS